MASILKPVDLEKFMAACDVLEQATGQKFTIKLVKGYTEVPIEYRESADWQTWHFTANALIETGLVENVAHKDFWINLYESNAKFIFVHRSADMSDILILENPYASIRVVRDRDMQLHSLTGPAVRWDDEVLVYRAEGIDIDKKFFEAPDTVTNEDISSLDLEKRRLALHIMGAEKFFEVQGGKPKTIDSGVDKQGNMMELLEFYDKTLQKDLRVLKVVCPSTQRIYYIYPPNQKVDNVWDAKGATFSGEKLAFRQGDVGLKFIDKENPDSPFIET